ncbi:uncharacterized protein LOC127252144 isoform X2 [Andrographis paniculata]|uniref:uncharacterized protein LOC127252144 isoform X2 n=1 Tax=Andrographis paniculata TaxID=175694 RepID=UPI0021E7E89A|nr:uncharacterized protein LOC127252144 isoform X2 [Andrographis paniculata]
MAFWKLFLLVSTMFAVTFAEFTLADGELFSEDIAAVLQPVDDSVSLSNAAELKLHRLKSKISLLEASIEDQAVELTRKDGSIEHMEKLIAERSNILTSLQAKIQSFQGSSQAELMANVKTRVNELEKQVVTIKRVIEEQNKKKDALKTRANVAEEKIKELNLKLENLQRINDEQKSRILKIQDALQMAELKMLKAKLEASLVSEQLKEVNQAWLPPWVSAHLSHCQSFVSTYWNEFGRPTLDQFIQKACEQKNEVGKWVQHYSERIKSKWFPAIKEKYSAIVDDFYPLMQSFSAQVIGYYQLSLSTIKPHIENTIEIMSPYFQEAKIVVMPYVNQISDITKPYLDKVILFSEPYWQEMVQYNRKITTIVGEYHSMASLIMALPAILLLQMLLLRQPKKRRHRKTSRSHGRKGHKPKAKPKRVHKD